MEIHHQSGWLTPDDIFFNRVSFTNINFFDFNCSASVKVIRENVAAWYYTLRIFSIAALLLVLLYIGIRMAISTVASDEAKYKKMITDWLVSFALLFLLHYIIIATLSVNNGLVEILRNIMDNMGNTGQTNFENLASSLVTKSFIGSASVTWANAICYAVLVGVTAAFLFSYIKRMLIIGFLIMIAPIITITYSMDRVGDGKAQALNTWFSEFMLNVLIQPFHCLIYIVFPNTAIILIQEAGWGSVAGAVLAIMCMIFIWPGEKIVKKIFDFEKSSTMADTVASLAAIKTAGEVAKKAAGSVGKAGSRISRNLNLNNNKTFTSIRNTARNMPVVKQVRDLSEKTRQAIDRGKASDNVLKRAGANIADQTGKAAKKITKTAMDPALGGAIAFTAMSAGANQKTSLNTGLEFYNTGKSIQTAYAAGKTIPADIQNSENNFKDMLEKYSKQSLYENYKTNQADYNRLKAEIQRLLTTNTNTLESSVQMMLQAFATTKGYNLNNQADVTALAADMDRLSNADLNTLTDPDEFRLAHAMQEKDMAVRVQSLSQTYTNHGITNPDQAVEEIMERIKDDTFDDGSNP